jgi:hypothetical protein
MTTERIADFKVFAVVRIPQAGLTVTLSMFRSMPSALTGFSGFLQSLQVNGGEVPLTRSRPPSSRGEGVIVEFWSWQLRELTRVLHGWL